MPTISSQIECVVSVEMARSGTPTDLWHAWRKQRDAEARRSDDFNSLPLVPDPQGQVVCWRGAPEVRDWDRMVAAKERDGYRLVSHRREFIHKSSGEMRDKVDCA